ncbi:unnamed protein product [Nesidiocoris tenuis]|uniref:Uncharacterized protein n=1 Tax=Nesidiocoris tenuis TaxID=355587 RepID=A0A6H5FU34_9HEMI|nr:unnamed protein product [Nesidiocoris tenuis]
MFFLSGRATPRGRSLCGGRKIRTRCTLFFDIARTLNRFHHEISSKLSMTRDFSKQYFQNSNPHSSQNSFMRIVPSHPLLDDTLLPTLLEFLVFRNLLGK